MLDGSRLAVFDLDGTLVDSLPDIAPAVNRLLARRGCRPLPDPAVAAMVGDGLAKLIERVFAASGLAPEDGAAAEYHADYTAHVAEESRFFPGIPDALAALRAGGWRCAVCTNKPAASAAKLLETLGVAGDFAVIAGGDSYPAHKPDPRHLALTIAAAGGGRAVMIGDHRNDVLAASGCGVPAVFAAWGYGSADMAVGAAAVAASPRELLGILSALVP